MGDRTKNRMTITFASRLPLLRKNINRILSINYLNPRSIEPEEIYVTPYFATGFHRSFAGLPSTNITTQVDPPLTEGWTWHPIYYPQSLVAARPKGRFGDLYCLPNALSMRIPSTSHINSRFIRSINPEIGRLILEISEDT